MPRPPRLQVANGIYHVTARGNRRGPLFLEKTDYERFLAKLDRVAQDLGWRAHAFCLLPNHFHLVLETPAANLAAGMHRVNGSHAAWFNRRYGFDGHVFQGRYYAALVETDRHLLELARYVSRNPVNAGLCPQPADWLWSSYRPLIGAAASPSFLDPHRVLGYFGPTPDKGRRAFIDFVAGPFSHVPVPGTGTWPDYPKP